MNDENELDGEISRALTLGGLTFATQLSNLDEQPKRVRVFTVPFQGPEPDNEHFDVVAYVSRPFLVVTCGLRLAESASLAKLTETLYRLVPIVRLVQATSVGPLSNRFERGTFWAEATTVIRPGPWTADEHIVAAVPVQVVANAVQLLLATFPSDVSLCATLAPFMEATMAPEATG